MGENDTSTVYEYTPSGTKSVYQSDFAETFGLVFDKAGDFFVSTYNDGIARVRFLILATKMSLGREELSNVLRSYLPATLIRPLALARP